MLSCASYLAWLFNVSSYTYKLGWFRHSCALVHHSGHLIWNVNGSSIGGQGTAYKTIPYSLVVNARLECKHLEGRDYGTEKVSIYIQLNWQGQETSPNSSDNKEEWLGSQEWNLPHKDVLLGNMVFQRFEIMWCFQVGHMLSSFASGPITLCFIMASLFTHLWYLPGHCRYFDMWLGLSGPHLTSLDCSFLICKIGSIPALPTSWDLPMM